VIQLSNLSKSFGDRTLIDHVTWQISDGDRVGLCGPNGAGKTTVLKMLADIDEPDDGAIVKPADLTIGYLPQDGLTHAGRTLFEEASSALPDNELTLRALVTARLSVATTTIESEERRLKLAHEALSLAQAANDESAQAYSLAALCDALAGPEHCQVRANYASDIIERARRLRNWPRTSSGSCTTSASRTTQPSPCSSMTARNEARPAREN